MCGTSFFSLFVRFNEDYNKRITTRDNVNTKSHDQEESKWNSTISANSGAHTLTHD